MAVAVVNKKESGSAATASLPITAATKGNRLAAFITQTGTATQPTLAGWTFNPTKAQLGINTQFVWFATKVAEGGEEAITVTPAAGGTIQGIAYWEVSGLGETVDTIVKVDNNPSNTTVTSAALTTADAGDIILAAVGSATASGAIEAWSASNSAVPVAIESTTSRTWGASYIPAATLSAVTITSKWATGKIVGMLVVAIKPSGTPSARTAEDTVTVSDSVTVASAHPRAVGDTATISDSVARTTTAARTAGDTIAVSESVASQRSKARTAADTVSVSDTLTRAAQSFSRTAGDTLTVTETATRIAHWSRTAGDTLTISDVATAESHTGVEPKPCRIVILSNPAANIAILSQPAANIQIQPNAAADITIQESM